MLINKRFVPQLPKKIGNDGISRFVGMHIIYEIALLIRTLIPLWAIERQVDWRNENVVLGSNLMSEMVISLDARFLVLESTKLFLFFANKSGIVQ